MKKFLIVASYPDSLLKFRGSFIDLLLSLNYQVHVCAPKIKDNIILSDVLEKKGIHIHDVVMYRTSFNIFEDIKTCINLYKLIRGIAPTYLLAYTCKPVIYSMLAAWIAKVPNRIAMITGLGYLFQKNASMSFLRSLARYLYKFSLRKATLVFFHNPDDKLCFQRDAFLKPSTPSVILNGSGVDLEYYQNRKLPSLHPLKFLLIARFLKAKGIIEYAQAAAIIKSKYPMTQFHLVGWSDGGIDSIEPQMLEQWKLEGLFNYMGYLDDVRPAIAESHVYVLPSYREGTPRSVLEAMSMGRAIITTDTAGCRETVVNGKNGFLVNVKCVESLVKAMELFILTPGLVEKMGSSSRLLAAEKFDVHAVNQRMIGAMNL